MPSGSPGDRSRGEAAGARRPRASMLRGNGEKLWPDQARAGRLTREPPVTRKTVRRTPRPSDIETIRDLLRSGEVARALQAVGDRWSFLLMRDAFLGVRRFEDLRRRTGASRGTLTARLNAMVDAGLLYRSPYGNAPSRLEYRLTEKGLAFYPVALCMWTWENRWGGEFGLPRRLVHTVCGKTLNPGLACSHCDSAIAWRDLMYKPGPGAHSYTTTHAATRRRERAGSSNCDGVERHAVPRASTPSATGGRRRWCWRRCSSGCTATTTSTPHSASPPTSSADRLSAWLLAAGVIERQPCTRITRPRHEYHLTRQGLGPAPVHHCNARLGHALDRFSGRSGHDAPASTLRAPPALETGVWQLWRNRRGPRRRDSRHHAPAGASRPWRPGKKAAGSPHIVLLFPLPRLLRLP